MPCAPPGSPYRRPLRRRAERLLGGRPPARDAAPPRRATRRAPRLPPGRHRARPPRSRRAAPCPCSATTRSASTPPRTAPGARPLICPPAVLQRQLEGLLAAGMQPVTGEALVDHLQLGTPLADNAVLVSFDDASGGQYTNALPILQRLGIPATFFVMTVVLDRPNWLSRDDVRALDAAGMTIASHTWDHHPVTRYGEKDWATQLVKPREQLEQIVGHGRRPVRLPVRPVEPGGAPARPGGGLPGGLPAHRAAAGRPAAAPDRSPRAHPAHVGRSDPARADLRGTTRPGDRRRTRSGYRSTCRHGERATVRRRHLLVTVPRRPVGDGNGGVARQPVTVRLRSFSPVDG